MHHSRRLLPIAGVLALLVVAACSSDDDGGVLTPALEVLGSGTVVQEQRSVSGFSSVLHASEGMVEIRHGQAESLVIRADDNLLPYLEAEVVGAVLQLRTTSNVDIRPTQQIEFEVTVVDVAELLLSGVGEVECLGIDRTRLDVLLSGVGDIRVSGMVTDQHITLSGVGDYDAEQLVSTNATVVLSGVGDATVRVSGVLDATVSGTGFVYYYGSPTSIDDHGLGRVGPGV